MPLNMRPLAFLLLLFSVPALAGDWYLSVQPILSRDRVRTVYQPLADYLSRETGETFHIKAYRNFLTYWASLQKRKGFDFVFDAAHLTGFRLKNMGYHLLARQPDTVSFSLVTRDDHLIFEVDELLLKKVATLAPPSVGALRLLQLFPDPLRQPRIVYAQDSEDAAQRVLDGKAYAAMIPTALVARHERLNTVLTTEPLPHMAVSASPDVPEALRTQVAQALIHADKTRRGRAMLQAVNLPSFVAGKPDDYIAHARLLDIMPRF